MISTELKKLNAMYMATANADGFTSVFIAARYCYVTPQRRVGVTEVDCCMNDQIDRHPAMS
jgi:hypothetical protein